jgi:hypothetical protein
MREHADRRETTLGYDLDVFLEAAFTTVNLVHAVFDEIAGKEGRMLWRLKC